MNKIFIKSIFFKSVLMIAMLSLASSKSNGQPMKPTESGYAPVNGIRVELMKTYQLLGGGVAADLEPMPKSHVAIVPSQGHVSLMMQTKTILGYLDDFLN